jgi:hypothetical protein
MAKLLVELVTGAIGIWRSQKEKDLGASKFQEKGLGWGITHPLSF